MSQDTLDIAAYWTERPETRDACAERCALLMRLLAPVLPIEGRWTGGAAGIRLSDVQGVTDSLQQNKGENGQLVEQLGWYTSLFFETDLGFSQLRIKCGGWSLLNNVVIALHPSLSRPEVYRAMSLALVEAFEPECVSVHSRDDSRRRADNDQPAPVIGSLVFIAHAMIDAKEVAGVDAVERVGSGTLLTLRSRRLDLKAGDDLALVQKVESVVRRYPSGQIRQPRPVRHASVQ